MNQPKLTLLATALSIAAWAQGPPRDTVKVDLPFDVIAGDSTITAGQHTFRQLSNSGAGSRVMLVNEDGDTIRATVITNTAVVRPTPNDTTVVIQRIGSQNYLDKIWIAGKNIGYQIPIPEDARSRSLETSGTYSLNANYSQEAQVAQAKPVPQQAPAREPSPARVDPAPSTPAQQPAPTPQPNRQPEQIAQAQPAPAAQQPQAPQETQPQTQQQEETLPSTSLNWMESMAAGAALILLGTLLFAYRRVLAKES